MNNVVKPIFAEFLLLRVQRFDYSIGVRDQNGKKRTALLGKLEQIIRAPVPSRLVG